MVSVIYIINLDKRPDRFQQLSQKLLASDLADVPVQRVSAFDSKENDYTHLLSGKAKEELQTLLLSGYRDHHAQLTPGAIGCYLSHFETWKKIANTTAPPDTLFLILEDDANVPANAAAKMRKGIAALAASGVDAAAPYLLLWEIICLEGCNVPKSNLFQPKSFWSLQSYTVSAGTARRLVSMPFFPIENQLDTEILFPRNARMLDIFAFPIFTNISRESDIQTKTRKNAPFRRPERGLESTRYPLSLGQLAEATTRPDEALFVAHNSGEEPPREACKNNGASKSLVVALIAISAAVLLLFILLLVMLSLRKR